MSDHTHKPGKAEHIQQFLSANRKILSVIAVVLIVGIIASVGVSQWLNARAQASAEMAEQIQRLWEEYSSGSEGEGEEALRTAIDEAIEMYPRDYASLRALFILGQLEFELENYQASLEAYRDLADRHQGTYIEPTALAAAAAAAEEAGDAATARELYGRLVEIEDAPNLERAHGLFNLGRLAESAGDVDLALEYYNRLVDEHGGSNWTNLGRNRIIWLTSRGPATEG